MSVVDNLRARFDEQLRGAASDNDLKVLKDQYLGRKGGAVASLMKEVASAPPEERPVLGRLANELKTYVESELGARKTALETARPRPVSTSPCPDARPRIGHRHPLNVVRERVEAIFSRMGYEILDGPETEDDYHNFEALHMPADHPARDMQDTLYLDATRCARRRSSRSGARGWRRCETAAGDAAADAHVRDADPLHGDASAAGAHHRAGPRLSPRQLRPDAYADVPAGRGAGGGRRRHDGRPERDDHRLPARAVRAGYEGAVPSELLPVHGAVGRRVHRLPHVRGRGCGMCKRTGWLEILGCGMVHPAVFEAVGYDPQRNTGFAFGMGIERIAMLAYGLDDIRLFYENDLRFLEQFPI